MIYQYEAARDYDPSSDLAQIRASLLVINSADDERNPPELRAIDDSLTRVPGARYHLVDASAETAGHSTVMSAKWWKSVLAAWLESLPAFTR